MRLLVLSSSLLASSFAFSSATIIAHESLKTFSNNGNQLTGIATTSLGAKELEAWHSSIDVGSHTPVHTHETEELVILIKGRIEAIVNGQPSNCTAPCTIVLPANQQHMLRNIGDVPTDHFLIMRVMSKIVDAANNEMNLPWRK